MNPSGEFLQHPSYTPYGISSGHPPPHSSAGERVREVQRRDHLEDVDSDELESDDEDVGVKEKQQIIQEGEEGDEEDEESDDEYREYQEYQKFISTIFRDDMSDMSGTDGDEDEDYSPNDAGQLLRLDLGVEDDDETDDEYFNVTRKEVRDLVDGSLQVLAKQGSTSISMNESADIPSEDIDSFKVSTDPASVNHHSTFSPTKRSTVENETSLTALESTSTTECGVKDISTSPIDRFEHFEQLEQMQKRNRLISAVVSKMFAGENEDNLVVDDMPIHNIRKLVARQMSMSLQLMIQMLLLSENMSESDRQCSSHLMELSNLRSSALTKTYLITEQMETVKAYQSISSQNSATSSSGAGNQSNNTSMSYNVKQDVMNKSASKNGHSSRFLFDVDEEEDEDDDDYIGDEEPFSGQCNNVNVTDSSMKRAQRQQHARINQHMTRNRAANDPSLTKTSSSIFNVPTLSRVHVLLQAIDMARKERDRVFQDYVTSKQQQNTVGNSFEINSSHHHVASNGSSGTSNNHRGFLTSMSTEERTAIFHIIAKHLEQQIAPTLCVRLWRCLLPSQDYPLNPDFVNTVNPASLYGSTIFTPAEDDLLLRGIISVNNSEDKDARSNGQWEKRVREKFLPSKEEQLLQYRQIQLSSGPEDSKFKRYRCFEMEKQRHQKWTSEEDKELLRGFQVFGAKWFMIKLYFLPNKSRHEIKLRWTYLLKDWEKHFQKASLKAVVKADGKLVKPMKQFLKSLHLHEDHAKNIGGVEAAKLSKDSLSKISVARNNVVTQPRMSSTTLQQVYNPNPFNDSMQVSNNSAHHQSNIYNECVNSPGQTIRVHQPRSTISVDDKVVETEVMSDSDSDADDACNFENVTSSQATDQSTSQNLTAPSKKNDPVDQPQRQSHYQQPLAPPSYPSYPQAFHNQHNPILPAGMQNMPMGIQAMSYMYPHSQSNFNPTPLLPAPGPFSGNPTSTVRAAHSYAPHIHNHSQMNSYPAVQNLRQIVLPRDADISSHINNPAPLDTLLANKSIPLLLGKKRKKADRTKGSSENLTDSDQYIAQKSSNASSVVSKESQQNMNVEQSASKRARNVHFDNVVPERDHQIQASRGDSFRLFDSVMSGANKR